MPPLEYLPAVVLIGYGAYKWHKTGMRKDLWTMALALPGLLEHEQTPNPRVLG